MYVCMCGVGLTLCVCVCLCVCMCGVGLTLCVCVLVCVHVWCRSAVGFHSQFQHYVIMMTLSILHVRAVVRARQGNG